MNRFFIYESSMATNLWVLTDEALGCHIGEAQETGKMFTGAGTQEPRGGNGYL